MTIPEKEQDELITNLVNAVRSTPRKRRQSFLAYWPGSGTEKWFIKHMGLPNGGLWVYFGDLQILGQRGFLVPIPAMLSSFLGDATEALTLPSSAAQICGKLNWKGH